MVDCRQGEGRYPVKSDRETYRPGLVAGIRRQDTKKRCSPNQKWVALTFDDGPHPNTTPRLLSILKAHHAKAIFFLVGMMAEAYPDLVLEEQQAGHLIANHTYHHVNLTKIHDNDVGTELEACRLVLQHITGEKPRRRKDIPL
ncbi:MAG: polysaccharide deacetylase family protein [Synergistaceae bacterium]|nr:polysaccharide deacetylase family protein [Synergistaceae bacterium]